MFKRNNQNWRVEGQTGKSRVTSSLYNPHSASNLDKVSCSVRHVQTQSGDHDLPCTHQAGKQGNSFGCKRWAHSQVVTHCPHQSSSHDPTWTSRQAHDSAQLMLRQKQHNRWHTFTSIRGYEGRANGFGKPRHSSLDSITRWGPLQPHLNKLKVEVTQSKIHHHVSDGQSHKLPKLEIRKTFLWSCYDWKHTSVWEFRLKDTPTFHHVILPCSTIKSSKTAINVLKAAAPHLLSIMLLYSLLKTFLNVFPFFFLCYLRRPLSAQHF